MSVDGIVAGLNAAPSPPRRESAWQRRLLAWGDVLHSANPLVLGAAAVALLLLAVALLAPVLAPYDPNQQTLLARLRPPLGWDRALPGHPLGTDQLGRDLLSRCMHGLRLTLALAFFGTLLGVLIGVVLGLAAGLLRGVGAVLMAAADLNLALPFILVALFVIAVAGKGTTVLVAVLGVAYWAHFARLVRAQVLAIRAMPYIEAARAAGATTWRLAFTHTLPNLVSPVLVMATAELQQPNPAGILPVVPGPGRAAAHGDAGKHGGAGPGLHGFRPVDRGGACPVHRSGRAGGDAARRLRARPAGRAAAWTLTQPQQRKLP